MNDWNNVNDIKYSSESDEDMFWEDDDKLNELQDYGEYIDEPYEEGTCRIIFQKFIDGIQFYLIRFSPEQNREDVWMNIQDFSSLIIEIYSENAENVMNELIENFWNAIMFSYKHPGYKNDYEIKGIYVTPSDKKIYACVDPETNSLSLGTKSTINSELLLDFYENQVKLPEEIMS